MQIASSRIWTRVSVSISYNGSNYTKSASINNIYVCLFGFYGIPTIVSYLMPNPFLYQ